MLTQKYRCAGCIIVFFSLFLVSPTYATSWHYVYSATLYPIAINGGGSPPTTASATGTFWYDDTSPVTAGYYPLAGLTFLPDATTTASSLDCDPIGGCLSQNASNFAKFDPSLYRLDFDLNVPSQSYALDYASSSDFGLYSSNNAYGDIVDLEISAVPVPAAIYFLGAGFVGLAGLRKKLKR